MYIHKESRTSAWFISLRFALSDALTLLLVVSAVTSKCNQNVSTKYDKPFMWWSTHIVLEALCGFASLLWNSNMSNTTVYILRTSLSFLVDFFYKWKKFVK